MRSKSVRAALPEASTAMRTRERGSRARSQSTSVVPLKRRGDAPGPYPPAISGLASSATPTATTPIGNRLLPSLRSLTTAPADLRPVIAILGDTGRIVPASTYLDGEYGYKGIYLGVPTLVGEKGIEKVFQIELTAEEKAMLDKSAASVQELVSKLPV